MQYNPVIIEQLILCCQCGIAIAPNPSNMCINCIRNEVDITEGIPKHSNLQYCRNCERYLQPPNIWVLAALESRELLALCLKKLKGLNKVRLIDAGFIWTEPHSKRIKVKLTIQKEVFASTILQQIFEVEFVVNYQQCDDCARIMAKNVWQSMVQVRQKVNHKKTFFFLEQLIIKHNAHKETINIKEVKDGIDFFYSNRSHAVKMVEFLSAVVPVRTKNSEQLISTDIHSNTSNYKFSYSVEIVPVCKDDLICLPLKIARSLGNIRSDDPLVICYRVGNSIHVMDPNTLAVTEITTSTYWRTPFTSLSTTKTLVEYYILDVEPLGPKRGKYILADIQVARSSDFGKNDTTFFARSHLGGILNIGDTALGYDLTSSNFNDYSFDTLNRNSLPDVVLIKKSYPQKRRKNKPRKWKLKSISKEQEEMAPRKQDANKMEEDYESFLQDLEEDPELRQNVNLYKSSNAMNVDTTAEESTAEEEDFPEIKLEELLEDLTLEDTI
ncbi:2642_t:CDS:2 [Funneliformis geosporum]|uniref:60S ribosomal export protein NMD3 n=1 Tax=Funneliformis geosporum TaxID=1117311 RepID=A0A9W4X1R0_9GLOM|nr:2642_t:CDS:2 [Funneliformis geosporum]CAI2180031.1 12288_t:CDS:2 [Funneliformis geosporum]